MWDYLVKKVRPRSGAGESSDLRPVHAPGDTGAGQRIRGGHEEREPGAAARAHVPRESRPERKLRCPVCGTAMVLEYIGNVEVDRCPDCRGIFLDKGELQQIKGRDYSSFKRSEPDHEALIYTPHGLTDHVT